jgi:RNA-directed DNA polymerase
MSSWTPNSFVSEGQRRGYPADYIATLAREGNRLLALGLPVVFTLGHLASICYVPTAFLDDIVRRKSDPYRKFRIRKRAGGYRQITVPDSALMRVQRWIHHSILSSRVTHSGSTAYAPKCCPRDNAGRHVSARWLVKIDITNFFEMVSERQVYHVYRSAGFAALLAFQLARICTRIAPGSLKYRKRRWRTRDRGRHRLFASGMLGHLPQGAPTSPMLANLVCLGLDRELEQLAATYGCTFSRYADDIAFSAVEFSRDRAAKLIRRASEILGRHGFVRNKHKTHVATPGSRRIVTGLLIDTLNVRLTREFKETIRLHLYHAGTKGIYQHCLRRNFRSLVGFRAHLQGMITYAEHIEPAFGDLCRNEFNLLPWHEIAAV